MMRVMMRVIFVDYTSSRVNESLSFVYSLVFLVIVKQMMIIHAFPGQVSYSVSIFSSSMM